ncbi:hypothetical protein BHE90_016349 [Fusarium euwallaceae]|uniref:Uncharacterized protein n=1 Tax=Fusarium euwallaceae TaxID=1147111 RepID=A0A430L0P9_9HYPO|nr:hypothetical protein BHE90_016349 [Fusarium euwallaceae]
MADNENTKTQAEEDRLLMPPHPLPATDQTRSSPKKGSPQKTAGTSMTLRPRKNKNKNKPEPEPVATATITGTDTADTTGTNDNTDTKKPEDDTKESEDSTKKLEDDTKPEDDTKKSEEDTKPEEDDLPPIEPFNWRERLLFPGIIITEPRVWYDVPMSPKMKELWRKVAPQAGDRMLTVDEVDKLCDEFYKESRE